MRPPLSGHNLVRLLYLDEAGTDFKASHLYVGGVIVHGDYQWPSVDERILELIERFIPINDRVGFYFHSTDIYHGAGYFDRRKPEWADKKDRHVILCELAKIIGDLHLPVVWGNYRKEGFGFGKIPDSPIIDKHNFIHSVALIDCLIKADEWIGRYFPHELATVVHEDGTPAKNLIKRLTRAIRSKEMLNELGLEDSIMKDFRLPLSKIIDTVHFAEKEDARPLQLADLCAFASSRLINQKHIPEYVAKVVTEHMRWATVSPLKTYRG